MTFTTKTLDLGVSEVLEKLGDKLSSVPSIEAIRLFLRGHVTCPQAESLIQEIYGIERPDQVDVIAFVNSFDPQEQDAVLWYLQLWNIEGSVVGTSSNQIPNAAWVTKLTEMGWTDLQEYSPREHLSTCSVGSLRKAYGELIGKNALKLKKDQLIEALASHPNGPMIAKKHADEDYYPHEQKIALLPVPPGGELEIIEKATRYVQYQFKILTEVCRSFDDDTFAPEKVK